MKRQTFYSVVVLTILVALGVACGTPEANSTNARNADTAHDMSNMHDHDMSNMHGASAPNAANQPFDLQFIDTMIHHHDGAVKMSRMIIPKTKRVEIKSFAQKIIDDQQKEIEKMKSWRDAWYAGKPSALNLEMPGMAMSDMTAREKELANTSDADVMFLDMMTPHHEGAIKMAEEALKKAEHREIKQLAEGIIRAQRAEIEQMNSWKKEWSK